MALHINNPKANKLARKLAKQKGETLTDAVIRALEERLNRLTAKDDTEARIARLNRIAAEVAKLPVLDDRTADEIMGFDERGLFD